MFAARLWWMLTFHGHPEVYVLEGGYSAWLQAGRKVELYEPCTLKLTSEASFESKPQPQLRADIEQLSSWLASFADASQQQLSAASSDGGLLASGDGAQVLLLDTRSPDQYKGEVRRGSRAGHIPTARQFPRSCLMQSKTQLQPLREQRRLLEQAGVDFTGSREQKVVVYCNGGVAAMQRIGLSNWSVYDGSWNEYAERSELAVEL